VLCSPLLKVDQTTLSLLTPPVYLPGGAGDEVVLDLEPVSPGYQGQYGIEYWGSDVTEGLHNVSVVLNSGASLHPNCDFVAADTV
jgi:hypothetical protein